MALEILPNDAWTQARERFVEDLDESEKTRFANATFENVFYSASAAQKTHEAKSVSRALAAKMNTLLMGIDGWGKALDVYSDASAMIVSPVWGSIRVLIHVCRFHFLSDSIYVLCKEYLTSDPSSHPNLENISTISLICLHRLGTWFHGSRYTNDYFRLTYV